MSISATPCQTLICGRTGSAVRSSRLTPATIRHGRVPEHYLEENDPATSSHDLDAMNFAFDLIRNLAMSTGLLPGRTGHDGRPAWRDMRAKTSHTYNEITALDVVAGITGVP